MITEQPAIEGTWEEIAVRYAAELAGKRVRVTVLDNSRAEVEPSGAEEIDRFLDAFAISAENLPPPPPDAYSREALYADHD